MQAKLSIIRPAVFVQTGYRLLFFYVLLAGYNADAYALSSIHSMTFCPESEDAKACAFKTAHILPESCVVRHLTYTSDVCFQQEEFDYLVGIKDGQTISHVDICKGLCYISKKNKFATITVTVRATVQDNVFDIHIDCQAFRTFRKLKFKGVFVGKEQFRQCYLLEYGERFDENRHADSLQKIKDLLHREGYFNADVKADVVCDEQTKSVTVLLHIDKGSRFFVENVEVEVSSSMFDDRDIVELREFIRERFGHRLAKNYYTRALIDSETQELKAELAGRGYVHVEIKLDERYIFAKQQVTLIFTIDILYKKKLCFTGNRFFSQKELLDSMLVFGKSIALLPASVVSEELIKSYHRKGFWSVAVQTREESGDYHFIIDEGSRAFIAGIEIRNVQHADEKLLIKKFFAHGVLKHFYDATEVESAVQQVLAFLVEQGFWQAELLREYAEPIDTGKGYVLVLIFDEGKRCFLKEVTCEAYPHFAQKGPFKAINKATSPIPFDMNMIDRQREWLLVRLQRAGCYQPRVKPECRTEDGNIFLNWKVDIQDAQARFDKTVVQGSSTFPFAYIMRELDYSIGDLWHRDALRHSLSRLKKMEVFESVHLFPDKDAEQAEKIMLLKLQKDDPFEVKMRLGLGAQHVTKTLTTGGPTYRVGGSFIYKNPFNAGDQARFDADFTRAIRLVNLQYRRPWIFGLPITAELQGYTNRFEYPGFIGSQKNLYTVIQQGVLVNFAGVYSHVDTSVSTGIEIVDTFIDESTVEDVTFAQAVAQAINFRPDLLDKNIPFFQLQPTVMLYFLDNTVNPTRGSFSVLSAKGMFPLAKLGAKNFFIRLLVEQSFFIPLMPFVFAMRLRAGHIFHPQLCTIIPIERFYLGGANSIRSYETDQCPPLGLVPDVEGADLYVPQGGRSLVNVNVEMRFPLYNKLGGVLFGDLGALSSNSLTEIRACDLLSGVGFGLRYNTPIGPLRFDFAWRGHKRDGVGRPYAWFLSFGNAFI